MKTISILDEFQERLILDEKIQVESVLHREVYVDRTMNLLKEVTINLWFDRKANSSSLLAGMDTKSSLMKKLTRFYLIV